MSGVRVIKKYPNRRLYDTGISSYITLEDVRQLIAEGEDFEVRDNKTGEDVTRHVLMQLIAEHEEGGEPLFSTPMLVQIIRLHGDSMQGVIGNYLERCTQLYLEQYANIRPRVNALMEQPPFAFLNQLAERNLELWKGLQEGLSGIVKPITGGGGEHRRQPRRGRH
jgi:polyhydroxyalkanoate synthesis repressor PhaR